jgi:hypothetical protein
VIRDVLTGAPPRILYSHQARSYSH